MFSFRRSHTNTHYERTRSESMMHELADLPIDARFNIGKIGILFFTHILFAYACTKMYTYRMQVEEKERKRCMKFHASCGFFDSAHSLRLPTKEHPRKKTLQDTPTDI